MGSKIKHMSAIPGWTSVDGSVTLATEKSPVTMATKPGTHAANVTQVTLDESTLMATTQTAVVLAQLAQDSTVADTTLNTTMEDSTNIRMRGQGHAAGKGHKEVEGREDASSGFVTPKVC